MCVMHVYRAMSKDPDIIGLRKKLKLSRSELAKRAGVNVSTVCRWETKGIPRRGSARAFIERLLADVKGRAA